MHILNFKTARNWIGEWIGKGKEGERKRKSPPHRVLGTVPEGKEDPRAVKKSQVSLGGIDQNINININRVKIVHSIL